MKYIDTYLHPDHALGVIIELQCNDDVTTRLSEFHEYSQNIAMQVAAEDPGKDAGEYQELALMDQYFIKDDSITIRQYTDMFQRKLGVKVKVVRYVRFSTKS
jgi:translation elongation factor EF-Ts